MALLENYTLREIVNTDVHELAESIHQNSNNQLGGSTPIEKITTALKRVLKKQLKSIPQTLITVDGIGPILTAEIISEIGDIHRFDKKTNLASYASLTWTEYQSGSFTAEETHLTKKGNKYLRYYLVEAAKQRRNMSIAEVDNYCKLVCLLNFLSELLFSHRLNW